MNKTILITGEEAAFSTMQPLLHAYSRKKIAWQWQNHTGQLEILKDRTLLHGRFDAVLLLHKGRRSPSTLVDGPAVFREDGTAVPIGVVCYTREEQLQHFARAAASVQLRKAYRKTLAILAQRHPRYFRVANRVKEITHSAGIASFHWPSGEILPGDMIKGLDSGIGSAIYLGHGRPIGWVGYYGVRIHHFEKATEPIGALLSICCHTANRKKTAWAFSEEVILHGVAASAFGAIKATLHTDNTRWAVRITESLLQGAESLGELIIKALPENRGAANAYRILGDPMAPLYSTKVGVQRASGIPTWN